MTCHCTTRTPPDASARATQPPSPRCGRVRCRSERGSTRRCSCAGSARARSTAARRGCWRWCWRWWLACTSSSSACSLAPPTRAGSTLRTRRCRATAGSARAAPYPASAATSSPRGTSSCSPASSSPPPSSCSASPPWGTATGPSTSASRASSSPARCCCSSPPSSPSGTTPTGSCSRRASRPSAAISRLSRLSRLYHGYISATSRLYLGESSGEHLAASRARFGCIRLHSLPSYSRGAPKLCTLDLPDTPRLACLPPRRSSTCSV
mmetsp:Transcript_34010/g.109221  ORF Transcript_34010/g.109221 Transcript_34010/m.109221 type:complete len:266 (-) Transcript_34010:719-1516(-)